MKKYFALILGLLMLLIASKSWADQFNAKIFNSVTIPASGTSTSPILPLQGSIAGIGGYFTVYYEISGSGTAKIEYLGSLDGETFIEPTGASDVGSSLTATSGPGTDGKDILSFAPIATPYYKIKVTETGGSSTVTISMWMFVY